MSKTRNLFQYFFAKILWKIVVFYTDERKVFCDCVFSLVWNEWKTHKSTFQVKISVLNIIFSNEMEKQLRYDPYFSIELGKKLCFTHTRKVDYHIFPKKRQKNQNILSKMSERQTSLRIFFFGTMLKILSKKAEFIFFSMIFWLINNGIFMPHL